MLHWNDVKGYRRFLVWWSTITLVLLCIVTLFSYFNIVASLDRTSRLHLVLRSLRVAQEQLDAWEPSTASNPPLSLAKLAEMNPVPEGVALKGGRNGVAQIQILVDSLQLVGRAVSEAHAAQHAASSDLDVIGMSEIQRGKGASLEAARSLLYAARLLDDRIQAHGDIPADLRSQESGILQSALSESDRAIGLASPVLGSAFDQYLDASVRLLELLRGTESLVLRTGRLLAGVSVALEGEISRQDQKTRTFSMVSGAILLVLILNLGWVLSQFLGGGMSPLLMATDSRNAMSAGLERISERMDALLLAVDQAWTEARRNPGTIQKAVMDSRDLEEQALELEQFRKEHVVPAYRHLSQSLVDMERFVTVPGNVSTELLRPLVEQAMKIEAQLEERESMLQQELESLGHTGVSLQAELRSLARSFQKLRSETQVIRNQTESLEESGDLIRATLS